MKFVSKDIPEGINNPKQSLLYDAFLLIASLAIIGASLFFIINRFSDDIVELLPDSMSSIELPEKELKERLEIKSDKEIDQYHKELLDAFISKNNALAKMKLEVYFSCSQIPNAFALPGNKIIINRGLYSLIESKSSLLFILAHEIAHHSHKHILKRLVRLLGTGSLISIISFGDSYLGSIINNTTQLISLKYSRDHENEADETAIKILKNSNIPLNGAGEFFKKMSQSPNESLKEEKNSLNTIFSTHPLTDKRIERIENHIRHKKAQNIKIEKRILERIKAVCD